MHFYEREIGLAHRGGAGRGLESVIVDPLDDREVALTPIF